MNIASLRTFLLKANKAGYAAGDDNKWINEPDKSTTIIYKVGKWRMHDNFFGGEPYGGRMTVSYDNKPYWIMVYYGWVEEGVNPESIYPFLRKALSAMPKEFPYRGPKKLKEGTMVYKNNWQGMLDNFSGEEIIYKDEDEIYKAKYIGGLVDQQRGV